MIIDLKRSIDQRWYDCLSPVLHSSLDDLVCPFLSNKYNPDDPLLERSTDLESSWKRLSATKPAKRSTRRAPKFLPDWSYLNGLSYIPSTEHEEKQVQGGSAHKLLLWRQRPHIVMPQLRLYTVTIQKCTLQRPTHIYKLTFAVNVDVVYMSML